MQRAQLLEKYCTKNFVFAFYMAQQSALSGNHPVHEKSPIAIIL